MLSAEERTQAGTWRSAIESVKGECGTNTPLAKPRDAAAIYVAFVISVDNQIKFECGRRRELELHKGCWGGGGDVRRTEKEQKIAWTF